MKRFAFCVALLAVVCLCQPAQAFFGFFRQRVVVQRNVIVQRNIVVAQPFVQAVIAQPIYSQSFVAPQAVIAPQAIYGGGVQAVVSPGCASFFVR